MNIMILVNKDFEYAGYSAGVDDRIRSNAVPSLQEISYDTGVGMVKNSKDKPHFSRMYKLGEHIIREYCISYIFPVGENTSNSQRKHELLKELIDNEGEKNSIDLIISVSTSESTPKSQGGDSEKHSVNGCVFIGNRFYATDCSNNDPKTESHLKFKLNWHATDDSAINKEILRRIANNRKQLEQGMTNMPKSQFDAPRIYSSDERNNYVSLGVINVMDYEKYSTADEHTYVEYELWRKKQEKPYGVAGCLETTHAVIKMAADQIPVLFISPIVDRFLCFDKDVDKQWGYQNACGSFNAGVVVASLLQHVIRHLE